MAQIDRILSLIRSVIDDNSKTITDVFTYTTSAAFTLGETNGVAIVEVLVNDSTSGVVYSYSSTTNKVTITSALASGAIIKIKYTYYANYSDTILKGYVDLSLSYISNYGIEDFRRESGDLFYPIPTKKQENLIALVAGIILKPNYSRYNIANTGVQYPERLSKEEKIREVIMQYKLGAHGIFKVC